MQVQLNIIYNKYTIYTQLLNYSMQLFKVKRHACDL